MTAPLVPLAVTMGDPAGCGPLITVDAWRTRRAHVPVTQIRAPRDAASTFDEALPVLPLQIEGFEALDIGTAYPPSAPAILESIQIATELCLAGSASAVVTNPIAKSVLYAAGFKHPGHTEFIADLCAQDGQAPPHPVMMLVGGGLRVSLATIHVPLMRVLEHLTEATLRDVAQTTDQALKRDFALQSPRIAFTGLNPHAGEDGTIGTEERDLINPVAADLRASGVNVSDARSADTVFHEALHGQYDAVIAMTHDQGLIPVKTLDMWGGVNTTLGLPIIRTSPDHGTAFDAAKSGSCRSDSLIAALKLATLMAHNREQYDG